MSYINPLLIFSPGLRYFVSMSWDMLFSVSFRSFLRNTGLVLTGLVFLGSIEISASSGGTEGKTHFKHAKLTQSLLVSDDLLDEAEEEQEVTARAAFMLPAQSFGLLPFTALREDLQSADSSLSLFLSESVLNPRGPPAI